MVRGGVVVMGVRGGVSGEWGCGLLWGVPRGGRG